MTNMLFPFESLSVSVIGLGYVGLPLAVAISDATFDSSFCKAGFASVIILIFLTSVLKNSLRILTRRMKFLRMFSKNPVSILLPTLLI